MSRCAEYESLLIDRASGALEIGKEAEIEEHLKGCPRCSGEGKRFSYALERAKLPPVTPREQLLLASLATRTLAAWRNFERRRLFAWGASLGFALAAVAAVAVTLVPVARARSGSSPKNLAEVLYDRDDPTLSALYTWGTDRSLTEPPSGAADDE